MHGIRRRQGGADEKTIRRLVEIGIRKTARGTGIHSDAVTLIARREPVKPITLAKVGGFIQQLNHKGSRMG
jgi:hypothetical protein